MVEFQQYVKYKNFSNVNIKDVGIYTNFSNSCFLSILFERGYTEKEKKKLKRDRTYRQRKKETLGAKNDNRVTS